MGIINAEILQTLECIECWDIVKRPVKERVVHMKFTLKRKKDKKGRVCKY